MKTSPFPSPRIELERQQIVFRWIKFNAVGGLGILVQLAMLAALRSWMNLDYLLATGVAVEIAVIHNFLWHERFTWADRPAAGLTQSAIRLIKFNATNGAVSLAVNLLVMRVFVGAFRANLRCGQFIRHRRLFFTEFCSRRPIRLRSP